MIQIPTSLNNLTVQQFQEVNRLIRTEKDILERHIKMVACLSGHPVDFIEKQDVSHIGNWARAIDKLLATELNKKITRFMVIGKTVYKPILKVDTIKAGQLIALKHYEEKAKGTQVYLHEQLACVYAPLNWMGRRKPYDASKHNEISSDMLKAKVGDVYGTLFFYTNVFEKLNRVTQIYLKSASDTIQDIMPEVMEWARANPEILRKNGLKVL